MKKLLSFILIFILSAFFVACGNDDNTRNGGGDLEITITAGGEEFTAKLYDNETAQALRDILPLSIIMSELNNNEKYYYLPDNLPASAANPGMIKAGDIMLYGANCLVLFYQSFTTSYSYTKIGRIEDAAGLAAALGSGSAAVTFTIK